MFAVRHILSVFSAGLIVLGASVAYPQEYPSKVIRIVTSTPGGANDFTARILAVSLSGSLGQPVIVENRPVSLIGETVARAAPDGYTLLVAGDDFWISPLFQKPPYDPERDFIPITLVTSSPLLLVVHPSLPVKTVKELIDLAKARPGVLNYSASLIGAAPHLAAELFKSMTHTKIEHIKYNGGGPSVTGVVVGEVQLTFGTAGSTVPHVKSGRLRALAVTTLKPSALFPELPTIAATLPGYDMGLLGGMLAPAKSPTAIITRLNQEVVRLLRQEDVKAKFFAAGVDTVGSSSDQFAATMKSDIARTLKIIKDAGIKADG